MPLAHSLLDSDSSAVSSFLPPALSFIQPLMSISARGDSRSRSNTPDDVISVTSSTLDDVVRSSSRSADRLLCLSKDTGNAADAGKFFLLRCIYSLPYKCTWMCMGMFMCLCINLSCWYEISMPRIIINDKHICLLIFVMDSQAVMVIKWAYCDSHSKWMWVPTGAMRLWWTCHLASLCLMFR